VPKIGKNRARADDAQRKADAKEWEFTDKIDRLKAALRAM
jgi:hypothetical protein